MPLLNPPDTGGSPYASSQPTNTPTNQPVAQQTWGPQAAGGIAGTLGSQLLPQYLQNVGTAQTLEQQLAMQDPLYNWQQQYQQQQHGFQQQQFGQEQAGLGLQRTQLGQQQQHLAAGYGFQQQQDVLSGQGIARNIQDILKQYGYQQQEFGIQGQRLGLQGQQLGIQQGQLNLAHDRARSQLAGAGTYTAKGVRGGEEQDFRYSQGLLDISKKELGLSRKELGIQRGQAAESESMAMFGQQQAQKELALTEAQQKEQYGYSTQQVQDGLKQLNLQQQSLGISEAQANSQYQNALQQLGLSNVMSVQDLRNQIGALAGGGYSPIASMIGDLTKLLPFIGGMFTQPQGG